MNEKKEHLENLINSPGWQILSGKIRKEMRQIEIMCATRIDENGLVISEEVLKDLSINYNQKKTLIDLPKQMIDSLKVDNDKKPTYDVYDESDDVDIVETLSDDET